MMTFYKVIITDINTLRSERRIALLSHSFGNRFPDMPMPLRCSGQQLHRQIHPDFALMVSI